MTDDGELPTTRLDSTVDSAVKETPVKKEKVKNGIAAKATALPDTSSTTRRSWTMGEVDRIISSDILPSKVSKLTDFALGLDIDNDFRLRDFTRRITSKMNREYSKDINVGRAPERVRYFDIQSQAMRQITANASLGTYQFQKTQTLPYMRKSLSLGYQQVDVLKKIASGIASLEKGLLSKLEAIKLNTAAPDHDKTGFLKRFKERINNHVMNKVAGNIGNVILAGYDDQYKKYVSPVLERIQYRLHKTGHKTGGINGIVREASHGLNSIRHKAREIAEAEPDGSVFGRVKAKAAKITAKGLAPLVRVSQKPVLSEGKSSFIGGLLKNKVDFLAKIDPFSIDGKVRPVGVHGSSTSPTGTLANVLNAEKDYNLLSVTSDLRDEQKRANNTIIKHLAAIQHNTSLTEKGTPKRGTTGGSGGGSPKPRFPGIRHTAPKPDTSETTNMESAAAVGAEVSIIDKLKGLRKHTPKVSTPTPHIGKHTAMLHGVLDKISHHVNKLKDHVTDAYGNIHVSDHPKVQHVYHTLTHKLGTLKTQTQGLANTLGHRLEPHKGTINRISREARHKAGTVGATALAGGTAAVAAGAGHLQNHFWKHKAPEGGQSGPLSPHDKEQGGGWWSYLKGAGEGMIGETILQKMLGGTKAAGLVGKKSLTRRVVGGTAKLAYKGTKGAVKLGGKALYKGVTKGVPLAVKSTKLALKGGIKATPYIWKGAKGAAKLSGSAALGLGKLGFKAGGMAAGGLSKGAFSLGKGALGAIGKTGAVGIAGMVGKHFVDKYTKAGSTGRRVGDTAADMMTYGALGAEIGSIIPGVGTVIGGALGAGVAAIVDNSDLISKSFGYMAHGVTSMGNTILHAAPALGFALLGPAAPIALMAGTKSGRKKIGSFLGDVKDSFFGHSAKYDKFGNLVTPGKKSFIERLQAGWQKLMFGDRMADGKYAKNSSTIDQVGASVSDFMKGLKDKASSAASTVGTAVSNTASAIGSGISSAASAVGSAVSSGYSAVSSGVSSAAKWVGGKITSISSALDKIMMDYEGGAKIISDTGGLTKYGISAKANPGVDIKNLTQDQAKAIYMKKYVAPLGLDKLSPAAAFIAIDASINQGLGYAKKLIAQTGGDPSKMIATRRQMYADLAAKNPGKYGKYLKGWNNRLDKLQKDAGGVTSAATGAASTTSKSGSPTAVPGGASSSSGGKSTAGTSSGPSLMAPTSGSSSTYKPLSSASGGVTAAAFSAAPSAPSIPSSSSPAPSTSASTPTTPPKPTPVVSTPSSTITTPMGATSIPAAYTPPASTTPSYTPAQPSATTGPEIVVTGHKKKKDTGGTAASSGAGSDMAALIAQLVKNAAALDKNTSALLKSGGANADGKPGDAASGAAPTTSTLTPGTTSSNPMKATPPPAPTIIPISAPTSTNVHTQSPQTDITMSMKKIQIQTGVTT